MSDGPHYPSVGLLRGGGTGPPGRWAQPWSHLPGEGQNLRRSRATEISGWGSKAWVAERGLVLFLLSLDLVESVSLRVLLDDLCPEL